jgi:DNA polymerase-3 subunit alpha
MPKIVKVETELVGRADSLPDIDTDYEAGRREEVKQYLISKYGSDRVCYVGTNTTLKLRSGVKDLGRASGLSFQLTNLINELIPDKPGLRDYKWGEFFDVAANSQEVKKFAQDNPDLVNMIRPMLGQPKANSVHASAVIVTPKHDQEGEERPIWEWVPVRRVVDEKNERDIIVSEWSGEDMDRAGFLKLDILGLKQLDKFTMMLKIIKKTRGEEIDLLKVPLDDDNVFHLFQRGMNEDIFQFNTYGMIEYCRSVEPTSLDDLINMNALYRPGPMGVGAHKDYASIKHGHQEPVFDFGLHNVTKDTYGLYIFQEQIMKAVNVLGGLSLVDADNLRSWMKKKKPDKILAFKRRFIAGAVKRGCDEKEADQIWEKMASFAGYGFNKSHASAYSIMAYWAQWLKNYYPLEFFVAAFTFADKEMLINSYLHEIYTYFPNINVSEPDVNKSDARFFADIENETIYWSLLQVKNVGEAICEKILAEREKNGPFKSITDFVKRFGKPRICESLILAGAFDEIYKVEVPTDRYKIIKKMFEVAGKELPAKYDPKEVGKNYFWLMNQIEYTGLGNIRFPKLVRDKAPDLYPFYCSARAIQDKEDNTIAAIACQIVSIKKSKTRKGQSYARMTCRSNTTKFFVTAWPGEWAKFEREIASLKKSGEYLCMKGKIRYDSFIGAKRLFLYEESELKVLE